MAMNALGYALAPHVIDAADVGVPQHRRRLFIVATRSMVPLRLHPPRVEHTPARSVIDFSAGRWSPVEKPGRAKATLARVRAGREAHGDRFLVAYYGSAKGGRSLDRPLGTLTTRARWAVVNGDRMRMVSPAEARAAMGFPDHYDLPPTHKQAHHVLGNAVCPPVAAALLAELQRTA